MGRPKLSPFNNPPAWVNGFIGLPWDNGGRIRDGLDCYGLHRVIQVEHFGRHLPLYGDVTWTPCERLADQAEANRSLEAYMEGERLRGWDTVWEATGAPAAEPLGDGLIAPGDLIWIRDVGARMHIGTVVCPGWMLHIEEDCSSVCVPYDRADFERRVMGFYRWRGGC